MFIKEFEIAGNIFTDSFHPDGIPAKYIIDSNGNIRFKVIGFNGREEETVTEVSEMIDIAKQKQVKH